MLKVLQPVNAVITGGYSDSHKGYDHSGKTDPNYKCSLTDAEVVYSKNSETRSWIANTNSDPYKPASGTRALTNNDYGNWIRIKGKDLNGVECYQLGAHFEPGSVVPKGYRPRLGETVATVGSTGNSTGRHSHSEYSYSNGVKTAVEFSKEAVIEDHKPMFWDKIKEWFTTKQLEFTEGKTRDLLEKGLVYDRDISEKNKVISEQAEEIKRLSSLVVELQSGIEGLKEDVIILKKQIEMLEHEDSANPIDEEEDIEEESVPVSPGLPIWVDSYPEWKKAAWEAWRTFFPVFVATAVAMIQTGVDWEKPWPWLVSVATASGAAGYRALLKWIREKWGEENYGKWIYKLPG